MGYEGDMGPMIGFVCTVFGNRSRRKGIFGPKGACTMSGYMPRAGEN